MDTLGELQREVENRLSSSESHLRLVQFLMEYSGQEKWKLTPLQRGLVEAIVTYVYYKRRFEIWKRRGKELPCLHGCGSGPEIDLERRRQELDAAEEWLAAFEGQEIVDSIKKRLGKQLSLHSCVARYAQRYYEL